jgi:DNA mismatch endonuclease (patch repair protein)
MQAIKGKNTKPEVVLRKALFAQGLRYRLHDKKLPGRPDIVLPRFKTAIYVHGCFFHGHNCPAFRWPSTRPDFWRTKIEGNKARDERQLAAMKSAGWKAVVVWECELRGQDKAERVAQAISKRLGREL